MYLLDTNVLSETRRMHRADPNVWAWSQAIPADNFFLSAGTILEIEQGILLIERRDKRQAALFADWLRNRVLPQFEGRILAFDTAVALRCAQLHVPDPHPERDSMIAATALVHSLVIATRNVSDFQATGVGLLSPWTAAG